MAARALALLLALLMAPLPVAAQAEFNGRTRDQMLVSMDFQDVELPDVIKAVAKFTGKNFLYDDRVRGRVTVISETKITVDEAYRVFESILQVKGFTTVDGPGGVTKILPIREAKEAPLETVTGRGREPNRDLYITRLVPLSYVKADTIANTFRPLVSKDANVIAYSPTNTMIVTDTAANIRRIMTILAEIDIQTYQDQIKMIPIEYADASQVAQQLSEIFSEGESQAAQPARRRSRARTQRAGAAQAAATADAAAVFGAAGQPRFITDERTNSIIVIAPSSTTRQVERLVRLLDYKRKGTGRIHVYRLQNADSEEMAQTLGSLTSGGGAGAPAGRAGGAAAAQGTAAVAELEGGVRVTADAPTNSLIIQASSEGFAAIRDVIEDLDVRRPQVMVEALIMEVDVDDNTALGVGWLTRTAFGTQDSAGEFGSNTAGDAFSTLLGIPPNFLSNPGNFIARVVGGSVTVPDPANPGQFIDVPVIQAFIRAASNDSDANIIASPTLLTADNEEAQIIIGDNIPIPTSRLQTADPSGVEGGFQTSQNIERQDVGVTLRVTPQISEGDTVRLEIFQELSEVDEAASQASGDLGVVTRNRQIENTVYVANGESVMIGGILRDNVGESVSKVPWLGDIPFLGWFFKSTAIITRKTNLLLVLTPHIVRDPEDLEKLTIAQRERFRASTQGRMAYSEDELEERRKAQEAGIPLPLDPNPVRRELDRHSDRYPTESFPLLEERQEQRENERQEELEETSARAGGAFRVQVAVFQVSGEAASLLEELIRGGYDGTVYSVDESGQTLHIVQLGPFTTEERAQQVARDVGSETGRTAMVILEP